jgi:hypothetical protein
MANTGQPSGRSVAKRSASSRSAERAETKSAAMKAEDFDKAFDEGEDVSGYIDWDSARRPGLDPRRVNVDFPSWVVTALDREAKRLGVTRQALIKLWIAERLEKAA